VQLAADIQQPQQDNDHDHDIQNSFDRTLHGDVCGQRRTPTTINVINA
jgi:hypothetical protein